LISEEELKVGVMAIKKKEEERPDKMSVEVWKM